MTITRIEFAQSLVRAWQQLFVEWDEAVSALASWDSDYGMAGPPLERFL